MTFSGRRKVSTAFLVLSALAADARAVQVQEASGRWAAFVGEKSYLCRDRSAVWVWAPTGSAARGHDAARGNADTRRTVDTGETDVSYVTSAGESLGSWQVPGDVNSTYVSEDCRTAWFVDADALHIFSIRLSADPRPIALAVGQKLVAGVNDLTVSANGLRAWVRFSDDTSVALAERRPEGLVISRPRDLERIVGETAVQGAFRNERVWIVPDKQGLWLADFQGAHAYQSLSSVNVASTYAANEGRLAWVIPTGKGLYLVDYRDALSIKGARRLLPDENVSSVRSGINDTNAALSGQYAWVLTQSHNLYCFKTTVAGDGVASVEALNGGKPIGSPQSISALPIETVIWTGNGSRVWAVSTRGSGSHVWANLWSVAATDSGEITATQLPPHLYGNKHLGSIYTDQSPQMLWVRTNDLFLYEIDAAQARSIPNPFRSLTIQNIAETDRPSRLWLDTTAGRYLVGEASDVEATTTVSLGGQILSSSRKDTTLSRQLNASSAEVQIGLPVPAETGHVVLSVFATDDTGQSKRPLNTVAYGEGTLAPNGKTSFPMFIREPLQAGRRYDVQLHYSDERLFDIQLTWPGVTFSGPWYERPYIRGVWLLIVPVVLLCLATRRSWTIRRWIPIVVPGIELLVPQMWPSLPSMTLRELITVSAVSVAAPLFGAVWSPPLLRSIADVHPFRILVPAIMQLSMCRRRFYSGYAEDLRRRVVRARADASNERYFPVTCGVVDTSLPDFQSGDVLPERLAQMVSAVDPAERVNLLIESPGGRGKSALLHELMQRALDQFTANPTAPLPVLGDPNAATIEQMVAVGLGRHRISDEFIATQLRTGNVCLFIDGIGDGGASTGAIDHLFAAPDSGDRTRVCATCRPGGTARETLRRSDRWIVVSPDRLNDRTAEAFVLQYAKSDGVEPESLPIGKMVRVARSADGTYLPLLVRLAMLTTTEELESVADLYAATLERLVGRAVESKDTDALVDAAEALALDTYWNAGERTFRFDRPGYKDRGVMERLLAVGLLVGADPGTSRLRSGPRNVRFVHDSMQSYLVARALFGKGDWAVLTRTAGDPTFWRAESELLMGQGSELFQMCLHVFGPQVQLRDWLVSALRSWSDIFGTTLAIEQIRGAISQPLLESVDLKLSQKIAAGDYLERVTTLLVEDYDDSVMHLGSMFGVLARTLWNRDPPKTAAVLEVA